MGAYKPHPVWKPNEMCACPVCSAYVPKVLFQFHRCPPGSGVRESFQTYRTAPTPPASVHPVPTASPDRTSHALPVLVIAILCVVVGYVIWILGL